MNFKKSYFVLAFLIAQVAFSQEGVAVYSDYLSDNYYLIHPSMAGASNCGKIRLTGRQQWFGQEDAPALQTISFNTSLDEDGKSGIGMIFFNFIKFVVPKEYRTYYMKSRNFSWFVSII